MSLKKILLAISLMAVVAIMGGASACPCSDWALIPGNEDTKFDWQMLVPADQPVGHEICVEAPAAPSGETWAYQWMVYVQGEGWLEVNDPICVGNVTVSGANGEKICVTPPLEWCSKTVAVRVTITTTTDGVNFARCIYVLCVEWRCVNPPCVTMTDFCEEEATTANLPVPVSTVPDWTQWTYAYTIENATYGPASIDLTTTDDLNDLYPDTYEICVYTTETGTDPGDEICACFEIKVYAKPSGDVAITYP